MTVTSPPFLNIIDYKGDNWLRCWFLGIDPKGVQITNCSKLENWIRFIRNTLKELCRVTVTGGYVALEVGEVRGGKVKLEQSVIEAARGLPLLSLGVIINQQEFTKTSNCWGVSNNSSGTNSNRIVLFKKCGKD